MSGWDTLRWDHRFVRELPADPELEVRPRQVHGASYSRVLPTPVAEPVVLAWSPEVASDLGLSAALLTSERGAQILGGNAIAPGMQPYAAAYGGHQFGHWAGQLGDGRAITLGELVAPDGSLHELQLKGAGPTPYSRGADGRAVLRSSIREFLCSEAMHHLGIPTTRALSLVGTGDGVLRDMMYDGHPRHEPGAIVCRVAPSFLRLGNYQLPASRRDTELLRTLVEHTFRHHFPHLGPVNKESVLAWLAEVCRSTAELMCGWMRVGFVHGVMNTDNLSILGLTIDYGPYGWVDNFDPDWTPNTTDAQHGRYRFGQQPAVGHWNLARLAEAVADLVDRDIDGLHTALDAYNGAWDASSRDMITGKLGFSELHESDPALWADLVELLTQAETDMTWFFRGLADYEAAGLPEHPLAPIAEAFYQPPSPILTRRWVSWLERYVARLREQAWGDEERRVSMHRHNPRYVLRNYLAQEAIDLAEKGDLSRVHGLLDTLRRPYTEQPGREAFAQKRPEWARNRPGCSQLSCSS
jgi:serine/tyrosine/threonine adenylyltransferase